MTYPWDESPEFCRMMEAHERTCPMGPTHTVLRRLLAWKLYNQPSIWTLPDDPFDPDEWSLSTADREVVTKQWQ